VCKHQPLATTVLTSTTTTTTTTATTVQQHQHHHSTSTTAPPAPPQLNSDHDGNDDNQGQDTGDNEPWVSIFFLQVFSVLIDTYRYF
jgi:hypothetical protein